MAFWTQDGLTLALTGKESVKDQTRVVKAYRKAIQ